MNTAIQFSITPGSVATAAAIASHSVVVVITIAAVAITCYVAREFRLGLRERRDDATARYMFARCDHPSAAFRQYSEVLKTRESPP